jgi:hypothetical protein
MITYHFVDVIMPLNIISITNIMLPFNLDGYAFEDYQHNHSTWMVMPLNIISITNIMPLKTISITIPLGRCYAFEV